MVGCECEDMSRTRVLESPISLTRNCAKVDDSVKDTDMPTNFTNEIITAAILGYEEQARRIEAKITELKAALTGSPVEPEVAPEPLRQKRRKMSAAGRRAIAEAQRKRWAEAKKVTEPEPEEAAKPKRRLSAAGRRAIIAATKKRWALKRAESAKAERAAKRAAPAKAAHKRAPAKKAAVKKSARKAAPPAAPAVTEAPAQ